jgi:hypothetical protein
MVGAPVERNSAERGSMFGSRNDNPYTIPNPRATWMEISSTNVDR